MKLTFNMKKTFTIIAMSFLLLVAPFAGQAEASSSKPAAISKTATSLIGIKYSYGGTTTSGFDCSGYVKYVFKKNNINLSRTAASMHASGTTVKKANLTAGDLVFFNTSGKGVSHVGIYIGDGKFSHASSSKGVKIDKLNDPHYWGKRFVGAKRVSGVNPVALAK